ncbi:hypothetical protein ARNL5_00347 [Anaerolineae bacterium]|nr:hypothetical protein [Anaerolineae bacterium]CAG0954043.1 hypothetical protein ARNL5_00347 [Anaerolineae bacterium]
MTSPSSTSPLLIARMLLVGAVTVIVLGAALLLAEQAQAQGFQRRLGEFQVEWYCNSRGYGVRIINNASDWACTLPNGQIAFILTNLDFDVICQATYRNAGAFAVRDQNKPEPAYNWSCYELTAPPTPSPTPIPPLRLGDFQVEWYCNERGFGVVLTNFDRDWACTNPQTGQIMQVLNQGDFTAICQRTYRNLQAFALKDGTKPTDAYNWSCFAPPPPIPQTIRLGEARPDVYCTQLGYWTGWVQGRQWACLNPGSTTVVIYLNQNEFNTFCRSIYRDTSAYAKAEGFDAQFGGTRWGCYKDTLSAPTPTPTLFVRPSATPIPRLTRLGEFQVEWYCNQQGYGVQVVNSNRDWACLFNGTNTIAKILGKNDFDRICQVTYRDPNAIAIKDGNNPTDAYNWSCYAFR